MKKYVLFGAGEYANYAVRIIGKSNIAFIMDNNLNKCGTELDGIPVYSFKEKIIECREYTVVISVSNKYYDEIDAQLKQSGITDFLSVTEIQIEKNKKKIENRCDYIGVYKKAIDWIKINSIENHAIICNSDKRKGYPEVTGYYIPTLIRWGYRELACQYTEWLLDSQKNDGSWYDTDDTVPYIFDTAQILKGLIAIKDIYNDKDRVKNSILRGVDWILSCMTVEGQLITPDTECWGTDQNVCCELIHLYCLSPLIDAGKIYERPDYVEKAHTILEYYKKNYYEKIMNFSLLSHFYAYVIEALLDVGEIQMAREAMDKIANFQKKSGAVPAYHNVDWVCSTGLFQLALIWFRLENIERGNAAFEYACKLQNETGGWYGSYISEENTNEKNTYFPFEEISWANKFFLDALYYKNKVEFEAVSDTFLDTISKDDERYTTTRNAISDYKNAKILDLGCGKGRYLKNLLEEGLENQYYGVDISQNVMKDLAQYPITCKVGTLTNIPFEENIFSVVYTCEALEHAIDFQSAIKEMARVTKRNGLIIVIDKNDQSYGMLEVGDWEQWPNEDGLKEIMLKYCTEVTVKHGLKYDGIVNSGLFTAWIGHVR